MSRILQVIRCDGCQAPVPLSEQAEVACAHCGAVVAMPASHREALRTAKAAEGARRAAEPVWAKLAAPLDPRTSTVALISVVVLPIVASVVALWLPDPPLGRAQIYALATLPALVPGAMLYLWAEAVDATGLRFRDAMSATPPKRGATVPSCRNCDAPLEVGGETISVTCPYCQTDNVVVDVPSKQLKSRLRDALRTLEEATRMLKTRRLALGLGAIAIAGAVIGAASLVWLAVH